jgi:SsrA-binding protein
VDFEANKVRITKMSKNSSGKKKTVTEDGSYRLVAKNRRAHFEFDLQERVEAGIVLTGTEVKSLRNGKASLEESYAGIERGEVWLYGCDIPEYVQANQMNHKSKRPRKLLLHRAEIQKLVAKATEKGLTLVPLRLYFRDGLAKVEICVARGRKLHDKRDAIKDRETKREIDRALRKR